MRNSTSTEVSRASHTHQVPHIGLPQSEPVTSATKVKAAPIGAARLGGDVGERMAPDQRAERGDRHHAVAEHRQPGGRHVDVHDPHRLALLVVGRGDEEAEIEPDGQQDDRRAPTASGSNPAGIARNRVGLARSTRAMAGL